MPRRLIYSRTVRIADERLTVYEQEDFDFLLRHPYSVSGWFTPDPEFGSCGVVRFCSHDHAIAAAAELVLADHLPEA